MSNISLRGSPSPLPPPFRPCLVGIGTSRVLCARVYAKERKGYEEEGNERKRNNEKNRRNGKGCEGERRNHYASVLCSPPEDIYTHKLPNLYIPFLFESNRREDVSRRIIQIETVQSKIHGTRLSSSSEQHFQDRYDGNIIIISLEISIFRSGRLN